MTRHTVSLGDRGRVPFALVGVLLVVSSGLFVAEMQPPARPPEPAVDLAMERTTADARATLRQAVAVAGVRAASEPVVTPANNSYGDALGEGDPFVAMLKLRIYIQARERFESVGRTHRGVRTSLSLSETPDAEAVARAVDRVSIEHHDQRPYVDATLTGVNQTARFGNRTVGQRTVNLSVRVHTPVMAVHERVQDFQNRLDADMGSPGLKRSLTARLYAVAWARGYAQYGGAPIDNVVSNRHVGLVTNGAVLGQQRAAFGRSDPDGRRAHARAIGAMALTEAMGQVDAGQLAEQKSLLQEKIRDAAAPREGNGVQQPPVDDATPGANDGMTVGVNGTAISVFDYYASEGGINETISEVYSADVRQVANAKTVDGGRPERPPPPDDSGDWEQVNSRTETSVQSVSNASHGPGVDTPEGFHPLVIHHRTVVLSHRRYRVWRRPGDHNTMKTVRNSTERREVTVAIIGRHETTDYAPERPYRTIHEPGGRFNGSNLADVKADVTTRFWAGRDPDRAAGWAAQGTFPEQNSTVQGEWPADLPEWAYPELAALRREIRNETVTVRRGEVGAFGTNPSARLAERLRSRRSRLVDAPAIYNSTADRARVALRGRYVDLVIARLERRANSFDQTGSNLDGAIDEHVGGSLGMVQRSVNARRVDGDRDDTGELQMTVDGSPPYLTLSEVTHDQVAAVEEGEPVYPLVAQNVNLFTVPQGDATDAVSNALTGDTGGSISLHAAAQALESADSVPDGRMNDSLKSDRSALRRRVNGNLDTAEEELLDVLANHGVGGSRDVRWEIVNRSFDEYDGPVSRARAVSNRSIVADVMAQARAHPETNLTAERRRDRLRVALHAGLQERLENGDLSVPGRVVSTVTDRTKSVVGDAIANETTDYLQERYNHSIDTMPAGLPLLPPISGWYATTNIWIVTVQGQYERFAVEAPRRTATSEDASLAYVRDGSNVTLDVNGDGSAELFGRADRIRFTVRTAVVVVVPSGKAGVGDKDGNADEKSPGWEDANVTTDDEEDEENMELPSKFENTSSPSIQSDTLL